MHKISIKLESFNIMVPYVNYALTVEYWLCNHKDPLIITSILKISIKISKDLEMSEKA